MITFDNNDKFFILNNDPTSGIYVVIDSKKFMIDCYNEKGTVFLNELGNNYIKKYHPNCLINEITINDVLKILKRGDYFINEYDTRGLISYIEKKLFYEDLLSDQITF